MASFKTSESASLAPRYQVVSFGDSHSDVGTYAVAAADFGGGRFTTNPGEVWPQVIARSYGDTLRAAYTGGFGAELVANPLGFGYAQGGARLVCPPSSGNATLHNANYDPNSNISLRQMLQNEYLNRKKEDKTLQARVSLSSTPIVTQVSNYLETHYCFTSSQLVLMNGGSNDIISSVLAVLIGKITLPNAIDAVKTAATQYAELIQKVHENGAKNLIAMNVIDIGKVPITIADAEVSQLLTQLTVLFNATLMQYLETHLTVGDDVVLIDSFHFINGILENYREHGFSVGNTGIACKVEQLPPYYQSALFCSPALYREPNADQTYMFSDSLHLSTRSHALLAEHIRERFEASLAQRSCEQVAKI